MPDKKSDRWIEVSVRAQDEAIDDIVNFLGRYCTGGAVVERRGDETSDCMDSHSIVKGFLPDWEEETREKLEIALLLLSQDGSISKPSIRILEKQDWAESWKAYFEPQVIGNHTVIVPSWREYEARPDDIVLLLDPGMAFGTGLHPTTRLCLIALEQVIRPGLRVLDAGTGSGILGIAAIAQGADHVDAIDIDDVAVQVARENAELNHVTDRMTISQGSLASNLNPPTVSVFDALNYDLVLVNILAEIIIGMAPALGVAVRTGGTIVASGIIEAKADLVVEALTQVGIRITQRLQERDWITLVGIKE